jgi:hypothetical protein
MSKLLPLGLGMVLGVLLAACSGFKPDVAVEGYPQACCTSADPKLENFKGCRLTSGNCKQRRHEKWWMRGDVACGPVDEGQCEGGRCCHYRKQYDPSINRPIENWAPEGFDHPTNNVTDPNAKPQHELPEPGAPPKQAPEPKPAPTQEAPEEGAPAKAPASEEPQSEPVPR